MKRPRISQALRACAIGFVLVLSGCSTTETRIAEKPEAFRRMSPSDQSLVQAGRIREGMSQDSVYIAWGAPSQRGQGRNRGHAVETWVYYDTSVGDYYPGAFGYGPYSGFGYGFGYGGGFGYSGRRHRGHFYGGGFFYDPFYDPFFYNRVSVLRYPERTASFQNGRVIAFQFFPKPYLY